MEQWNHLRKVLNDFGNDFVNLVADKIIEADGIATGEMLNTLDFDVRKESGHFSVYLKHTDYFTYFDKGTKPHMPPYDPVAKTFPDIVKWIQDKPIYPKPDDNDRLPTVEQLAGAIAMSITKNGTEARDVFETAKVELIPQYEQKFADALAEDFMEDYLDGKTINDWDILKI